MRILVTGATGFLGGLTVDALLGAGHEVRALTRPGSDARGLERRGVAIARASYDDGAGLGDAVAGVDAVIHAAGGGLLKEPADVYRANTDTTRALLDAVAARAPGLSRFVLVSSLAAHGPGREPGPIDEASPPRPISEYGRSKLAAERRTLRAAESLPVTVVRPPAVYGPGDTRFLPLFRAVSRGVAPLVKPYGALSVVHGRDCALALALAATRPHPSGSVYFVADPTPLTRKKLVRAIARALGRRVTVVPVPGSAIEAAGVLVEGWGRAAGRAVFLSRDKAADICQTNQSVSPARMERELGFRAPTPLEEGLAETARWYREQGQL